jgi:hypothetical protein
MRAITTKTIQIHFQCVCGNNSVYQDTVSIKWSQLSLFGIHQKKDKKTNKTFLLKKINPFFCDCSDRF